MKKIAQSVLSFGLLLAVSVGLSFFAAATAKASPKHGSEDHNVASADHSSDKDGQHHGENYDNLLSRVLADPIFRGSVVNFGLLALIIIVVLRKSLPGMLEKRRETIGAGILEAAKLKEEAVAAEKSHMDKLSRVESDQQGLKDKLEQDAMAEKERLIGKAKEDASSILAQAEERVRQLGLIAETQSKGQAILFAMDAAEDKLRNTVSRSDKDAIADEFIRYLSSLPAESIYQFGASGQNLPKPKKQGGPRA